ncbi:MAG: rod shape-determining protein MreC [Collinsella sp.]
MRLIGDENSGVSAMVQDTRAQGLQGQADGTLRLEYVSVDSDVKVGDIIVTSGIGGVFPKGLPLGTVSSVEKSANDVYYTIVVRAQTTAENNEEVLVILADDEQSASDEDVSTANSTPQGTSRDARPRRRTRARMTVPTRPRRPIPARANRGHVHGSTRAGDELPHVCDRRHCVRAAAGGSGTADLHCGRSRQLHDYLGVPERVLGRPDPCRRVRLLQRLFYDLSAAVPVGVMSLLLTVGFCPGAQRRRSDGRSRVRAASLWAPSRSSLM